MTKRLKIGIIGLGSVAELHLEAYQELLGEIEIVALAEVETARLNRLSNRFNARAYNDYRQMIDREKLDIACVLTPAATHAPITIDCARAGVHVLCEKPLSTSIEAAQEMTAECDKSRVRLCYGASYRFLPALQKARELIRTGVIGDVVILKEEVVGGGGPENHKALSFAHYPAGGPGGAGMGLVDHGIHLIDTFTWLIDCEAESVFGRGDKSGEKPGTEHMHINFRNGAVGQLLYNSGTFSTGLPHEGIFSWGSGWGAGGFVRGGRWAGNPGCIHVHGTKGALRIFYYANGLFLLTKDGPEQIALAGRPAPAHFAAQLHAFVTNIVQNRPSDVPGEIGLSALRVLFAVYESFHRRALVTLSRI